MLFAILGPGAEAWGADVTYELTPDQATTGNNSTSYVTTAYSFTYNDIGWSFNQWNPSTLQIKTNQSSAGSEFNFKNTSAFPGRIKSVVITFNALTVSDASKLCFVGGSTTISSLSGGSAGTWNSTAKTLTWTPDNNTNFTHFAFYQNGKAASGTNYLANTNAIVITYEAATPSTDPSITCANITDVPYEGVTDAEANVTISNADDWTPSVTCDGSIVTAASLNNDNTKVIYSVSENEGDTDREGNFTITLSKDGEEPVSKVVSVTQNHFVVDYATLPFSYGGNGSGELPSGLTQNGLGTYSSSPKMKFDDTGDYLILKINENPGTLTFKIKGNSLSGNYVFKLQVSTDGTNFTDKKSYTSISSTTTTETIADLNASVRYIKWIYTTKANGNVALGDINLAKEGVKIPTFSIEEGNYWASQSVALSQADSKPIYYTTNDNDPTTNGTLYSEAISVTSTCTIKAAAQDGTEWSDVVSATYKIAQTYGSVAAVNAITENDIPIIVSMNNWTITSFSGNNLYVTDGTTDNPTIHIYDYYIPSDYMVGGKLSGSLKAVWTTSYDGEVTTIQNWDGINYSAPTFTINIDEDLENGTIVATPTTATAGTEISFSVTPDEGYRMTAESLSVKRPTDESVTFSGSNPYTFTMPNSDVTISAEFELLPTTTFSYLYSINGIDNTEVVVAEGTVITLDDGINIDANFTFAGWTTDKSDVDNILVAGSEYTIDDDVIFYAVYAREEQGYEENVVIVDGSTLNSTATTIETTQVIDGISYKFSSGAKKQAVQNNAENFFRDGDAVLIGRSGAYIHNDSPFGNGITKFEIYANKGASTKVSVGVYFSTNAITQYTTGESTWTETLSTDDHVYDASGKLPDGAKYFWYQVTNSNNSQIQFRITYKKQTTTTKYYTRVFLNEPVTDDITIAGPTIIPAGSILDMGSHNLTNTTASNLVIEDGGQLIHHNADVAATFQKNIEAINGKNGWYTIASPVKGSIDAPAAMTSNEYDLYYYDEPEYTWRNYEANSFQLANGKGYLYANRTATDIEFAGKLRAGNEKFVVDLSYESTYLKGFNLVGNPFAHNIIMGTNAIMTNENTGYYVVEHGANLVAKKSDTPIKPCQGFMVQATEEGQSITFNPGAKETQTEHEYITIEAGNSQFMDMAYICTNADEKLGKITLDNPTAKVYLQQNGNDYAIAPLGEATSMVVCFKAPASGTYTINVSSDHEGVSLKDMKTGYVTYVNHSTSYTFEASENDAESRFKIMFGTTGVEENGAQMFVFQSGSNLIISGEGCVQIIDMMGRVLRTAQVESNATVSTEGMTAGTYVVRMLTANGVQTQKVIVK